MGAGSPSRRVTRVTMVVMAAALSAAALLCGATAAMAAPTDGVTLRLYSGDDPVAGEHTTTPYLLGSGETVRLTLQVDNGTDVAADLSVGVSDAGGRSLGCEESLTLQPHATWACQVTVGPLTDGRHRVIGHLSGTTAAPDGQHSDLAAVLPFLIQVGARPSEAAVDPSSATSPSENPPPTPPTATTVTDAWPSTTTVVDILTISRTADVSPTTPPVPSLGPVVEADDGGGHARALVATGLALAAGAAVCLLALVRAPRGARRRH